MFTVCEWWWYIHFVCLFVCLVGWCTLHNYIFLGEEFQNWNECFMFLWNMHPYCSFVHCVWFACCWELSPVFCCCCCSLIFLYLLVQWLRLNLLTNSWKPNVKVSRKRNLPKNIGPSLLLLFSFQIFFSKTTIEKSNFKNFFFHPSLISIFLYIPKKISGKI